MAALRPFNPEVDNKPKVHLSQGRIQDFGKGGGPEIIWRAREREPIWGLGAMPPVGSRGQSPWLGGRSPLEAGDTL